MNTEKIRRIEQIREKAKHLGISGYEITRLLVEMGHPKRSLKSVGDVMLDSILASLRRMEANRLKRKETGREESDKALRN